MEPFYLVLLVFGKLLTNYNFIETGWSSKKSNCD